MPTLTVMHQDQQQPPSRGGQPVSDGPAVEDHGRAVTATRQAAAFYRQAQQAVDSAQTVAALRRAVNADPAFGLAVADLDAITQAPSSPISGHQMNWERHHIEVVRTAAAGNIQSRRRPSPRAPRQRWLRPSRSAHRHRPPTAHGSSAWD